ncbi:MAG: hypothetical protein GQ574_11750 [Crocinitomix sp.]|nr:hypothetical protein [Crocinitomix sp.]
MRLLITFLITLMCATGLAQKNELGLNLIKFEANFAAYFKIKPKFLWGAYYVRQFEKIRWYNSFDYGENLIKESCSGCTNPALIKSQFTEYNFYTGIEIRTKKDHFNVGTRISGFASRTKLYRIEKGYYMNPETLFFWTSPEGYTRKYNIAGGQLELVLSAKFKHGLTLNGDFGCRIGRAYYKNNSVGLPKHSKSLFIAVVAPALRIGYAF